MKRKLMLLLSLILLLTSCQQVNDISKNIEDEPIMKIDLSTYQPVLDDSMYIGRNVFALRYGGRDILYMTQEDDAYEVVSLLEDQVAGVRDYIKTYNLTPLSEIESSFGEKIEIIELKKDIYDKRVYDNVDLAAMYINRGYSYSDTHHVKAGENFWSIAEKYQMNVMELIDVNEGLDEKRLVIDLPLTIRTNKSHMILNSKVTVERLDTIPFKRGESIVSADYYVGEYHIKQEGIDGQVFVESDLYFENGVYVGEIVKSSKVIKEAQDMIYYQGSKKR